MRSEKKGCCVKPLQCHLLFILFIDRNCSTSQKSTMSHSFFYFPVSILNDKTIIFKKIDSRFQFQNLFFTQSDSRLSDSKSSLFCLNLFYFPLLFNLCFSLFIYFIFLIIFLSFAKYPYVN